MEVEEEAEDDGAAAVAAVGGVEKQFSNVDVVWQKRRQFFQLFLLEY